MIGSVALTVAGTGVRAVCGAEPDPRSSAIIGVRLILLAGIPSGGFGFGNRLARPPQGDVSPL